MQKKTCEAWLKKQDNKQRYFVDSSVLAEIILKQDYADECGHFLNSTKSGKKICFVSNSVMGEVFCVLLFNKVELAKDSMINAFEALLELVKEFGFVSIDKEAQ